MPVPLTTPVNDSVPRVEGQVAVGEDLNFQRKWWRFETGVWILFGIVLVCDVLGVFGRGVLAKQKRTTADGTLTLEYDRVIRSETPDLLLLRFGANAVHDGKVAVFISDSVVKQLGAERIAPQPLSSTIGNDGITYVFPTTAPPMNVEIQISSQYPGPHVFRIQVVGADPIIAKTFTMP